MGQVAKRPGGGPSRGGQAARRPGTAGEKKGAPPRSLFRQVADTTKGAFLALPGLAADVVVEAASPVRQIVEDNFGDGVDRERYRQLRPFTTDLQRSASDTGGRVVDQAAALAPGGNLPVRAPTPSPRARATSSPPSSRMWATWRSAARWSQVGSVLPLAGPVLGRQPPATLRAWLERPG